MNKNTRSCLSALLFVGTSILASARCVSAEDLATSLRLQYWTYGVDGKAAVRGSSLDISDADKVLDFQNNGVILAGEMLFDRWGLLMDLFLGKQSGSKQLSDAESVDWDAEISFLTLGGFWRFVDQEFEAEDRLLAVDGIAGVRPFTNHYELQFNPYNQFDDQSRGDSVSWVDPFFGGRIKASLNPRWELGLYGDVGGFGIGNASDLSLLLHGDVVLKLTPSFHVMGGYRYFDLDSAHENGAQQTRVDLKMTGPTLGIQGRF
jgi:hypothetical protein